MARRIITIVLAAVLAVAGGSATYLYSTGADRRAMADLEPTSVLVVAEAVPAGTATEELSELVEMREVPTGSVVPGAVAELSDVEGLVTSADLVPGEQLVTARFVAPEDLEEGVDVPDGHHRVSIELEPRRVIGGQLRPGDTVGVFVSLETEERQEQKTHLILHKVVVTEVRGGLQQVEDKDGEETQAETAEMVMVTLAVPAPEAEKVVYAAEYELLWLSIEPKGASENGTRIVTPEVIFE